LDQLNQDLIALFWLNGKYSFATVSLYQNGEILLGKNSPHWRALCIWLNILGTNSSYSSLLYCLFKIQYCLCSKLTHKKQFFDFFTSIQYIKLSHLQIILENKILFEYLQTETDSYILNDFSQYELTSNISAE